MILTQLLLAISLLFGIVEKKDTGIKEEIYTILIDPGHGGRDNGASINDVLEDEINLAISNKLFEKLISKNYVCYITRTGDYDLSKENSKNHKNEDLKKRVEYINTLDIDLFISIHLNTYASSDVFGPMVYYKNNDDISKNIALKVQENLNSLTNQKKVITKGDYYLFNYTNVPGILVECGFLSNEIEREKLQKNDYQELISNAIYSGIKDIKK